MNVVDVLKEIVRNDRTHYKPGERRYFDNTLPRGVRWATPRQLAERALLQLGERVPERDDNSEETRADLR